MSKNSLFDLFTDLLKDIFSAEKQIVEALPKVIKNVHNSDLKKALSQHLAETENQVERLKKIFKSLNVNPTGQFCEGMKSILQEGEEVIQKGYPLQTQDAAFIIACQKVEHYEIANYGSAQVLAKTLSENKSLSNIDFDEIMDLLQDTLDEESNADEKLSSLAEGGFFSTGVNEKAEKETTQPGSRGRRF